VTSNPTIFAGSLRGAAYDTDIAALAAQGLSDEAIFEKLATDDIRTACDIFQNVWSESEGHDGHVSLELEPNLAHDADASIERAIHLWKVVNRPNLMIKVPATRDGLPVVEELIAQGINVNVTLLFDVAMFEQVMDRHVAGLERLIADGKDPARVASVASFFVSRVDTAIDPLLVENEDVEDLAGTIAVANARAAYVAWESTMASERWEAVAQAGAQPQRPLWASTGTKNPEYSDVLYVEELIGPYTVNTMPLSTIQAFADHGTAQKTLTSSTCSDAESRLARLESAGIDLDAITDQLREDGVASFQASYDELIQTIHSRR
jgi:transaldolase